MNNLVFRIVSLVAGLLFGIGMVVSGMADPSKVIGFLDVTGDWDPSLAFVMGGALIVFMPSYFLLIKPRHKPVVAETFCVTHSNQIDARLVSGACLFGVGWGLAGICPGPAVSSLALGNMGVWVFFSTMMVGLGITNLVMKSNRQRNRDTQTA